MIHDVIHLTNPITLDFSALTQYEGSTTALVDPNGNTEGKLESYNIGSLGEINGVYSNGEIVQLGQISDCQIQQHIWFNESRQITYFKSPLTLEHLTSMLQVKVGEH